MGRRNEKRPRDEPAESDNPNLPRPKRMRTNTGTGAPRSSTWASGKRENAAFEAYYKGVGLPAVEAEWDEFYSSLTRNLPTTFRVNPVFHLRPMIVKRLKDHFVPVIARNYATQQQIIQQHLADIEAEKAKAALAPVPEISETSVPVSDEGSVPVPVSDEGSSSSSAVDSTVVPPSEAKTSSNSRTLTDDQFADWEFFEPPQALSWYPEEDAAWTFFASRATLKKDQSLKEFHEFIKSCNDVGALTRQEAVSMIPPLFMDVKADHAVLDLCAAPGSKTTQMLEAMHLDAGVGNLPSGVVIANEIDDKRCYMLTHQANRLSSPSYICTNHPAQFFPNVYLPHHPEDNPKGEKPFLFDRVLADVPCSGDGTLRKNFDLWEKWTVGLGLGLHKVQVQVAFRGLQLLKVGGRMVYSTCSFNPVEDEAVVAELLRRCKGTVEVVDVSGMYPTLRRTPGVSTWRVQDKTGAWCDSFDQFTQKGRPLPSTIFPPSPEEAQWMHLERAMRFLPHHHNTGGFFVCVLHKTADTPKKDGPDEPLPVSSDVSDVPKTDDAPDSVCPSSSSSSSSSSSDADGWHKTFNRPQDPDGEGHLSHKGSKEAPFYSFKKKRWDSLYDDITTFYDIDKERFPRDQLVVRSEGSSPIIYFVSQKVRDILQFDDRGRIRVINTGTRFFHSHKYNDTRCLYRPTFESLPVLRPYMGPKRKITITLDDLKLLLREKDPLITSFRDSLLSRFMSIENGGIAFEIEGDVFNGPAMISGWRARSSVHALVATNDLNVMKLFLL